MGMYINPTNDMTKEQFLKAADAVILRNPAWPAPMGKVYVCLVDNGAFTAAGVAYDKREMEAFNYRSPDDLRPKLWLEVTINKLLVDGGLSEMEEGMLNKLQSGK